MKLELKRVEFHFEINNTEYSAHWYLNDTAPDLKSKYEVSIFRGGGYKISYYTDHRICEKNSKEFITKNLNI